jgi:hypothetical protein
MRSDSDAEHAGAELLAGLQRDAAAAAAALAANPGNRQLQESAAQAARNVQDFQYERARAAQRS